MRFNKSKRGELGFETLVIVIALLLIASLAASMLLVQASKYKSKGHGVYRDARDHSIVAIQVPSIIGEDARDGDVEILHMMMKLMPGSYEIPLDMIFVMVNLEGEKATLQYRDNGSFTLGNDGFNTWIPQEFGLLDNFEYNYDTAFTLDDGNARNLGFDLDKDGLDDSVTVCGPDNPSGPYTCAIGNRGTHLAFLLTGSSTWVETPMVLDNGSFADISSAGPGNPVNLNVNFAQIDNASGGFFTLGGTAQSAAYEIGWDGETFLLYSVPEQLNEDLDDDGLDDYMGISATEAIIILSRAGSVSIPLDANISDAPDSIDIEKSIKVGSETFGTLQMTGYIDTDDIVPENVTVLITPERLYEGYFTIEYVKKSRDYIYGNLIPGDIVAVHLEAPRGIVYSDKVSIHIMDGMASTMPVSFAVKDTFRNEEKVQLYPTV